MGWYLRALKNYAGFSGRAPRIEYWLFGLFNIVVAFGLGLVGELVSQGLGAALAGIYYIAVLIPSLAVSVRRLHDTNRSGWWLLISVIPFGGIVLLIFFLLRGTAGDNDYGPDPS